MLRIGLTGGIGSGKSSVANIFKELGVPVIDSDEISHRVTAAGSAALDEIRSQLGDQFIDEHGALERKKLAALVFSDADMKQRLEAILHPRIRQQMLEELEKLEEAEYVVLVVPLLFETNFIELVDRVLVVEAPEDLRIARVMSRDARTEEQVRKILQNQVEASIRTEQADDILDNSGDLEQLRYAVEKIHHSYTHLANKIQPL